jgi:hypothetical protein
MCRVQYCDPWEVYSSKIRKARKEHECYECSRTICPGETYRYAAGLTEGRWDVFKLCAHCEAAGQWLQVVCHGYLYGGIGEELREHWEEEPLFRSVGLARLIIGRERAWQRTKWAAEGGLMEVPAWAADVAEATMVPVRERERAERAAMDELMRQQARESDQRAKLRREQRLNERSG